MITKAYKKNRRWHWTCSDTSSGFGIVGKVNETFEQVMEYIEVEAKLRQASQVLLN
jgi:hypothetical protein